MAKKSRKQSGNNKICPGYGWYNCDPIHSFINTPYVRKVNYRKANNLCIGCGKNPCKCKNKNA